MLNSVIFIILIRNKAGQNRNRAPFLGNGSGRNTTESGFSGELFRFQCSKFPVFSVPLKHLCTSVPKTLAESGQMGADFSKKLYLSFATRKCLTCYLSILLRAN